MKELLRKLSIMAGALLYPAMEWQPEKSSKGKIHPQFLFVCYYDEQTGEEKEILCKSSRVCYL